MAHKSKYGPQKTFQNKCLIQNHPSLGCIIPPTPPSTSLRATGIGFFFYIQHLPLWSLLAKLCSAHKNVEPKMKEQAEDNWS